MSVRSALSIAAAAAAACLGGAVPAVAAGPQAPCFTEYDLYQFGSTIRGIKTQYCEGKPPNTQPSRLQGRLDNGVWIELGIQQGNQWVYFCNGYGPSKWRLKAVPGITLTGTGVCG